MTDLLASATAALRAEGDAESGALASATRRRIVGSLERRARTRHRAVRGGTLVLVLLVGTTAWALSTGHFPLISRAPEAAPTPTALPELPAPVAPEWRPARPRAMAAVPDVAWPVAPETVAPMTVVTAKPKPAPVRTVEAELLYRKAHELHFRGGDREAALAAWDAYLAAEPTGRFAIEARYNRALVLVRLARYAEARTALAPYANGDIGYRQHEAAQLVDRLNELAPSGD